MRMRIGNTGPGSGIGCGGMLVVLGVLFLTPFGEWLIKGIGSVLIVFGVIIVIASVYYWIKRSRRGGYL